MRFLTLVLLSILLCSCSPYCVVVTDVEGEPIEGAAVLPKAPAFNPVSSSSGRLCFDYAGLIQAEGYELHRLTEQELTEARRFRPKVIVMNRINALEKIGE